MWDPQIMVGVSLPLLFEFLLYTFIIIWPWPSIYCPQSQGIGDVHKQQHMPWMGRIPNLVYIILPSWLSCLLHPILSIHIPECSFCPYSQISNCVSPISHDHACLISHSEDTGLWWQHWSPPTQCAKPRRSQWWQTWNYSRALGMGVLSPLKLMTSPQTIQNSSSSGVMHIYTVKVYLLCTVYVSIEVGVHYLPEYW